MASIEASVHFGYPVKVECNLVQMHSRDDIGELRYTIIMGDQGKVTGDIDEILHLINVLAHMVESLRDMPGYRQ